MAILVYPELSYKLVGILFEVHSRLGGSFDEMYYQRAVEVLLNKQQITYKRELQTDILFENTPIGKYFLDFLIDDKIVLELKAVPEVLPVHYRQVKSYLRIKNIKLGILANFRGDSLIYKRILNSAN